MQNIKVAVTCLSLTILSALSSVSPALGSEAVQDNTEATGQSSNQSGSAQSLEEIVVTAQKRTERLLDVPSSVSAISGDRLQSLQVNSLSDLADYVPGLAVSDGGAPGSRVIEIRGLSTGYYPLTSALVGTYVDDLPVGETQGTARGALFGLDLNPEDIEAAEVLKGPQGTLYGANTMGGLVKYVLRRPDLTQFEATVGTDISGTDGANEPNSGVRGAVNLPIVTDKLGVRLSGFDNYNAGYIDNAITGAKNINHSTESGGRGSLLWQVTDDLALRATILAQDVNAANETAVTFNGATLQPLNGPDTLSSHFPEPVTQQTRIYSIGIDWDLKLATLTSSTGWSRLNTTQQSDDFSVPFGVYCVPGTASVTSPGCPGYPYAGALVPFYLALRSSKFVEEIRLTSPENQRVQWMLGGFYTKETSNQDQLLTGLNPASYAPVGLIFDTYNIANYQEIAGFANVTYKITERFDLSGGARYSAYTEGPDCTLVSGGLFGGPLPPCSSLPSTGVLLWMGGARFHINKDAMLYARASTGYRPGSGCPTCGNALEGIPGVVNPDKTTNYELGFKGSLLAQRLDFEASVFHIDWNHIQINETNTEHFIFTGNGGTAAVNGFELTTAYQVVESLRLDATLGYTDAHLTQDALAAGGESGDQLPGSPRWTGSFTADYSRPLDQRKTILFGVSYRYKDSILNQFAHTSFPAPLGPQNIADLYTGLSIQNLTIRLYGKNIFNDRSYLGSLYLNDTTRPAFVPLQPRTIGLSLHYAFK
jgi:iron complex outermembrane recepter protein